MKIILLGWIVAGTLFSVSLCSVQAQSQPTRPIASQKIQVSNPPVPWRRAKVDSSLFKKAGSKEKTKPDFKKASRETLQKISQPQQISIGQDGVKSTGTLSDPKNLIPAQILSGPKDKPQQLLGDEKKVQQLPYNSLLNANKSKINTLKIPETNSLTKYSSLDNQGLPGLSKLNQYKRVPNSVGVSSKAQALTNDISDAVKNYKTLDAHTIYNSKFLKHYSDSLKKIMPVVPLSPFSKTVSKEQLVAMVNQKFKEESKQQPDSLLKTEGREYSKSKSGAAQTDLARTTIDHENLQTLLPMASSLIESKHLGKIDSIGKRERKKARILSAETETAPQSKLVLLKTKETVWQKSYFEGIVGFPDGLSNPCFQFSPTYAFHVTSRLSIGAGPNLAIRRDRQITTTMWGARIFTRMEFFNRRVYGQVEDQINPHVIRLDGRYFDQNNILAGVGGILPIAHPISLNVALFHSVYSTGVAVSQPTSWIFRIGISYNQVKTNPVK